MTRIPPRHHVGMSSPFRYARWTPRSRSVIIRIRYKRSKGISLRKLKAILEEASVNSEETSLILEIANKYLHPKKVKRLSSKG